MGDALGEPVHSVQTRKAALEPAYRLCYISSRELVACYPGTEHIIRWERPHWLDQLRPIGMTTSSRRDQLPGKAFLDASTSANTSGQRRDPARPGHRACPRLFDPSRRAGICAADCRSSKGNLNPLRRRARDLGVNECVIKNQTYRIELRSKFSTMLIQ
jgi:hypothetical protein